MELVEAYGATWSIIRPEDASGTLLAYEGWESAYGDAVPAVGGQ